MDLEEAFGMGGFGYPVSITIDHEQIISIAIVYQRTKKPVSIKKLKLHLPVTAMIF